MAGSLPKKAADFHKLPGAKLAIVASMWHAEFVDSMVARAHSELLKLDVSEEDIQIHRVPGSLELPYAARVLFEKDDELEAILAFGVVLKGATTHNESVIQNVVNGFSLVSDRYAKPIINEVIGVDDLEDARKRSDDSEGNKGFEAVFATSELLHWRRSLDEQAKGTLGFS